MFSFSLPPILPLTGQHQLSTNLTPYLLHFPQAFSLLALSFFDYHRPLENQHMVRTLLQSIEQPSSPQAYGTTTTPKLAA